MSNVLKDKKTLKYNYLSRYSTFSIYYNTLDEKYIYGITSYLNDSIAYVEYKVKQGDTLDSLANYYYGRPDFYWVIADFNKILDPLEELFGNYDTLKLPSLSDITFKK